MYCTIKQMAENQLGTEPPDTEPPDKGLRTGYFKIKNGVNTAMNPLEIMKRPAAYASGYENIPTMEQNRAKQLCWEYNRTAPNEQEKRRAILQELLGTCSPMTGIEPDFHCDYGFNIHIHGLAVLNYNCVILDTSPVNIGAGAFIAPGVCLACSGHSVDP